ncbi:uncharacterized protein EI97DRAFT_415255 [Westerdykella ornata]|uniref:Phospholipid/glycerol acyltransferase domain-containing protein n=1 Tax=Westerdykella ornata TaxID=318751 RepID=A0A6A6JM14_WESOR|nr:uncharacterized protein EI97DRAFT_415255 [Westerdykella ornata]KAF2277710.1 hypothetical protein EI97DRAFT_415255 [Westerdykella ornata]
MEKYSQFRDRGTAIAPFFPIPTPAASALWTPVHVFLFLIRLPLVISFSLLYFVFLDGVPVGPTIRKCVLWILLLIPGVWWVDLQVDGVKKGGVKAKTHLPQAGTIIASSFTSPLDPLYLAAIFSPIFTRSYPGTRKVEPISLLRAILLAFSHPTLEPADPSKLVTLKELLERHPGRIICVFPECTTTNGRGILPLSPSLLTADPETRIYPISLRYTPGDINTPVPRHYISWVWRLLSKPTHCMRVRIARCVYNSPSIDNPGSTAGAADTAGKGYDTNIWDSPHLRNRAKEGEDESVSKEEQRILDRVGEDLARLGRVKRVGLGVREKIDFLKLWIRREAVR